MADVPCNGCTICCKSGGPIVLHPALGDDPTLYKTHFVEGAGLVLDRRDDGTCIYLGERGCSIWPNSPAVCRAFDCRTYAKSRYAQVDPLRDDATIERGLELSR